MVQTDDGGVQVQPHGAATAGMPVAGRAEHALADPLGRGLCALLIDVAMRDELPFLVAQWTACGFQLHDMELDGLQVGEVDLHGGGGRAKESILPQADAVTRTPDALHAALKKLRLPNSRRNGGETGML